MSHEIREYVEEVTNALQKGRYEGIVSDGHNRRGDEQQMKAKDTIRVHASKC
jgi:hypothetical protein